METPNPGVANGHFLVNRFQDSYLHEVNRDAFNRTGSDTVFRQHFDRRFREEDRLHIVVGTDSGLLVRYALKHEVPAGSRFLFVELPELLPAIRERLQGIDLGKRVALVGPEEWLDYKESFAFQDYTYLGQIKVVQSLGAMDAYLPSYRGLYRDIKAEVDRFVWQVEFQTGSRAFVEKQIENCAETLFPAIHLRNAFKARTAVLLGGGPSLDQIVPWIKANRERLVVIGVSRISRRLLEDDLQPDIVVSIDPYPVSFDVSKEMLLFDPGVLLVHSHHITPQLAAQWRGPMAYLSTRFPWDTELNPENLPSAGPTVTNTALELAVDLGFSRVILGGVDLCYTRSGHTYASGSNERDLGRFFGAVGVQVETNGGWMADTRHSFATAVELMGRQAAKALECDCQIVNPAAGAARIPNVVHQAFDTIRLEPAAEAPGRVIVRRLPEAGRESRIRHYRTVARELARVNGRLRKIGQLSAEALRCNDGLFGRNGMPADFRHKKRMDKIERRLDRAYKDISPLVRQFGSRSFLRLVRPDRDKEWSDADIESWGRAYYDAYRDSSQRLLALIEATQARIEDRLAEEADPPDYARLLRRWRDDRTPGRAGLWRQRHGQPLEKLPAAWRPRFEALAAAFAATIEQRDTAHLQRCREEFSLAPVRSKLLVLFLNGEAEELERTAHGLAGLDTREARELFHLAAGYLWELREDMDEALAHYNEVTVIALEAIEHREARQQVGNPRLEDALRRLSLITLEWQDPESALLVLDSLVALSPAYEPQYAELLRLTGRREEALERYTAYLEKAPEDLTTMLKLGKLYQEQGSLESARWAFRYVLQKDARNQAAQTLLQETEKIPA